MRFLPFKNLIGLLSLLFVIQAHAVIDYKQETVKAGNVYIGTSLVMSGLTATTVPYLDSAKRMTSSAVTPTELAGLIGIGTSSIISQLAVKLTDPMAANGDLVTRTAGVPARLAIGTSGYLLTSTGSAFNWSAPPVTLTLSAVGASANANGATLTAGALNLQPASASFPGVVTTGTQSMAGAKTFTGNVNIGGTATITSNVSIGTTYAGGALNVKANGANWESGLNLFDANGTKHWQLLVDTSGYLYLRYNTGGALAQVWDTGGRTTYGAGSPVTNSRVTIIPGSGFTGLTYKANATGSEALFDIWDSGDVVVSRMDRTGAIGIGGTVTSSTVPALYFVGDTNTGISRSASDVLNLVAGGVTALKVDGSTALTTAGMIPYVNSSGILAGLGIGTTGQVLQSNGGAPPTWGTNTPTVGGLGTQTVFTASGTFTTPASSSTSTIYKYTVIGGGGNGGGAVVNGSGTGGGAGGMAQGTFTGRAASSTLTITINGVAASSTITGSGFSTVTGGGGTSGTCCNTAGGAGGSASGGAINTTGQSGGNGYYLNSDFDPGDGGSTIFPGGGRGAGTGIGSHAQQAATGYGNGGAGSANGGSGGAGTGGIVVIEQLTP